ncbi:MAG TPA: winged helix-turn-helix domain-containing protein [Vicinamibacteria bacterium]|nr:winged helix-turn-helix domain-containing protein [Vicinamibacteria bacterium]
MSSAPAGFEFGTFRLDPDKGVLWHDGALVPLTPKVLALLQALVEARGDVVPKANLMARVWPDTVVGDANLSVTVSALRRGLGQHAGDPAWVETVPRRGYRFTAPLRAPAASPALVLAILPFRGIGPDAEDHLGLGIADALIGALTGVENVTVRPTGAVAHFAHQHVAPLEAAEALGADAVLDGTVQRQDHRVRIAVQLIPRRAGLPSWAEHFEAEESDIFALHDRIAEQVALALRAKLSRWRDAGPRAMRRPGFDAWETYLRGRYLWARLDTDGVTKALGCFGEAASREPTWAEPRAGLAAVHVLLGVGGIVPPRRAWRVAGECAREALERDAVLPEAHLASAWVALYRDWAWTEVRTGLDRAAALGMPDLHHWRALVLLLQGDMGSAADALARARETDPFSALSLTLQALLHDVAGEREQSLLVSRRAVELRGGHYLGHWRLGVALTRLGRHDEAIASLTRAVELAAGGTIMLCELAWALAAAGRRDDADALLLRLESATGKTYVSPYERAKILVALGRREEALDKLEQAAEDRDPWVTFLGTDEALSSLRGEPRYSALAQRLKAGAPPLSASA